MLSCIIMKFADWFPYYQGIRADFGYSTEKDQEAAKILSEMIKKKALDPKILQRKIKGKNVIVIGAGPSLEDEKVLKYIKKNKKFVKIAADSAVQFLIENKIKPDIVVTDLDGNSKFLQKAESWSGPHRLPLLKMSITLEDLQMATGACFWQKSLALRR